MDHLAHATVKNINHKRWFKNLNLAVTEYSRHSKIFVERREQRRKKVKKESEELRN